MKAKVTQRNVVSLPDGTYRDTTPGLCLVVKREGRSRWWAYRRSVDKKRYDVGLGSAASIPLEKARAAAKRLAGLTDAEFVAERNQAKEDREAVNDPKKKRLTFAQVVELFIARQYEERHWTEEKSGEKSFRNRLRNHVLPLIGSIPIDELSVEDVARVADETKDIPATQERCLSHISVIHKWAGAKNFLSDPDRMSPASKQGRLKYMIPATAVKKGHRGALSPEQLPDFFAACLAQPQTISRLCFEFSVLCALRSETARKIRWEHVNWEEKIIVAPANIMKVPQNGPLVIPMCQRVKDLLKRVCPEPPKDGLIFSTDGKVLSDSMVSRHVKLTPGKWIDKQQSLQQGKEVRATQHGIARATFMTWSQDDVLGNDLRFDVKVAHRALHHVIDDGEGGAYERQTLFLRRRELMTAWADYCFSKVKHSPQSSDSTPTL
jgi:integrase